MKVVQINTVTNGCTGRIVCSLSHVLKNHGIECMVAYGRGRSNELDTYRISNPLDYSVHGLLTRIFDTAGLHSKHTTKRLIRMFDEYKPDVIHLHNLHGYYINYDILFEYLKKHNIRVFWTIHDCWPFTGHCPYYTYVGCEKWKKGCHDCQQKLHHPTSYLADRSTKNYEDKKKAFCGVRNLTIITPSMWMKRQIEQSFLREYHSVHIPNGIILEKFHPTKNIFRQRNNLESKIVILGVANLWAVTKGLNYFIELSEKLPEEYQIVVVGLSKRQKEKLPDKIIGIEKTENLDELVDIYSSSDVFLNPTSEDNFPTTNIEALACGTPVVTFNTGGSPEAIDATCGLVVEKDIDELRNACLKTGRKSKDVVEMCIKRAQNFDENKCYGRYLELYESRY